MNRDEALQFVRENIKTENLVKHMLATEAVMRALASELGEDEDRWGIAGLVHDVDLEILGDDLSRHSLLSAEMVKEKGFDDEIVQAVAAHNGVHGLPRESKMAKALYACDPLTGLITASALVRPDKKLASVKLKSVKKRFKEARFAANASRDQMKTCEPELGIELTRFIEISLTAMQGIADDLGL
ncbi:HDIG domain-containing protein [bacterium]|nr:HDIG domain-containing protein [bacterium]